MAREKREGSHWGCKQGRSWCSVLSVENTGKRRRREQGESQSWPGGRTGACWDPGWMELERSSPLKFGLSLSGPGFGEGPWKGIRQIQSSRKGEKEAGKNTFPTFPGMKVPGHWLTGPSQHKEWIQSQRSTAGSLKGDMGWNSRNGRAEGAALFGSWNHPGMV